MNFIVTEADALNRIEDARLQLKKAEDRLSDMEEINAQFPSRRQRRLTHEARDFAILQGKMVESAERDLYNFRYRTSLAEIQRRRELRERLDAINKSMAVLTAAFSAMAAKMVMSMQAFTAAWEKGLNEQTAQS